jgi:antitoxin (DNA-binding transcriptional repressor) of toxin-antitoxin stability system
MRTVTFTEFRKNASGFVSEVERGETLVLIRRGRPVAGTAPVTDANVLAPAWRRPGLRLAVSGDRRQCQAGRAAGLKVCYVGEP